MPVHEDIVAGSLKGSKAKRPVSLDPRLSVLVAAISGLVLGSALGYLVSSLV